MAASSAFRLRIEGMDCAACALKIENAMKRLPGVSDINVSYTQESMAIMLDAERTPPRIVEAKIKSLGFVPIAAKDDAASESPKLRDVQDQAWWK
jgi:Cd2+/Zn2+-exporting ATPase